MKRIAILGSTGSIGVSALDVISALRDEFKVIGLSTNSNVSALTEQIKRFRPKIACVMSEDKAACLKNSIGKSRTKIVVGLDGLLEIVTHSDVDLVLVAIAGSISLLPLLEAIKAKKQIALASKEALVSGGEVVMKAAKRNNVKILPVDSEHSAIFQCLNGDHKRSLKKIYLTGSGGPLRRLSKKAFHALVPEEVINHPKWSMGKKISVDSATLMNKGLEVIEAMRLFSIDLDSIEVLIHPEAVVHSMVEFVDGSILAQMAVCDMRIPIQYALGYPERMPQKFNLRLDLKKINGFTFSRPDLKKFPCLKLAYHAARDAGTYPAVLNASNEEAVLSFLDGRIRFTKIPEVIEKVLSRHRSKDKPALKDILEADKWSREEAKALCFQ
ncbi:MAG: 1-deoxy-D-xylulose-5-phosphate reductoisomerase [Candidatus Omnitrophica bacterium]|nr:1-deoxy-D-xylulose-5-phosphate reductoisomerase [Candidatus Omnitrophota bacterium]